MPITLKDIRDDERLFPDGAPVSVNGIVKLAWEVKQTQYGPQQGFVLVGDDGTEISCQLSGEEDGTNFAPLQKGDQLEIYSTPSQKDGRPCGTKIDSYVGKSGQNAGKRIRQIKVRGLTHLRVLNRQIGVQPAQQTLPPASTTAAPAGAQQQRTQSPGGKLTVSDWLDVYAQGLAGLATIYDARMPSKGNLDAFIESAPIELLDLIHRGAISLCIAIQDGKVVPNPPPPPQHATQSAARGRAPVPDLDWMRDDDDPIPF